MDLHVYAIFDSVVYSIPYLHVFFYNLLIDNFSLNGLGSHLLKCLVPLFSLAGGEFCDFSELPLGIEEIVLEDGDGFFGDLG